MLEGNANYNALISASVLDALYFFVREVKTLKVTTSRAADKHLKANIK